MILILRWLMVKANRRRSGVGQKRLQAMAEISDSVAGLL
jgi:hypothetical protein